MSSRKTSSVPAPAVSNAVIIVGARKFIFSHEAQESRLVTWWDTSQDRSEIVPSNLSAVFVKTGLARFSSIQALASKHSIPAQHFEDETQLFPELRKLGLEPDPTKAKPLVGGSGQEFDTDLRKSEVVCEDVGLIGAKVISVPVNRIIPNPNQPRVYFNKAKLVALGHGLLRGQRQPITLIPHEGKGHDYMIWDGERRWRASKAVGKESLFAIVAKTPASAYKLYKGSAIANMGREGHQPMEIAHALRRVRDEEHLTVDELAFEFCTSVGTVTGHLRLLRLPESIQVLMDPELPDGERLEYTAATEVAKIAVAHHEEAVRHIITNKLNIDQVRHYIRHMMDRVGASSTVGRKRGPNDDYRLFVSWLKRSTMGAEHLLDLPAGMTIEGLFRNRAWTDAEEAEEKLAVLVGRIEMIRKAIAKSQTKKK